MKAYRAGRSRARFVATALYSKWPSSGGEQIELEVPGTLVLDVLAVDHHTELKIPLGNVEVMKEPCDVRRHREPALSRGRELFEGQPAPVADLDGVRTALGGQKTQHVPLEEGGVHAELQRKAPAEGSPQAVDNLAEKPRGLLGVVHIARPVLHAQDVARLGEVGQQRVVAGIFPMMRIEPAEGPAHGGPCADHRAIEVDRQPGQGQPLDGVDDEGMIKLDEWGQGRLRELAQPVADRARCGDPGQPAEARDERIAGDIAQVLQPAGAHVEQRQDEQGQAAAPVVPSRVRTGGAQPAWHLVLPQIAAEQLQPAVRGQFLLDKLDVQLPLDQSAQARYAQSHQRGLLCVGSDVGTSASLKSTQEAFLFHEHSRSLMPQLFSDWGPGVSTSRSDKTRIDGKCHNLSVTRRSAVVESCRVLRARGAGGATHDGEAHGTGWFEG